MTPTDRANLALCRASTLRLAKHIGWNLSEPNILMPPAIRDYLYEPRAHLILVSDFGESKRNFYRALEDVRCDALLFQPSIEGRRVSTFYFKLVRFLRGKRSQFSAARLWIGPQNSPYLVPDQDDPDAQLFCFSITANDILPAERPWYILEQYRTGIQRGDEVLLGEQEVELR
jgi:hypothetical protein